MRKTLFSAAILGLGLGLVGCSSKSIELDASKAVIFDKNRDDNLTIGGGSGNVGADGKPGTMVGKKQLPKGNVPKQ